MLSSARRMKVSSYTILALIAALMSDAAGAQQVSSRSASLAGGFTYYDIRGEGYVPTLALRVDQSIAADWLVLEGGATYIPLLTELAVDRTHLVGFEGQVQLQLPTWSVRPYVGVGGGTMVYLTNPDADGTFAQLASISAGVRVAVRQRWMIRGDARLHLWERARSYNDPFVHGAAGINLGLSRMF